MTTATTEANHALDNAAAWNADISAAHEAWLFCQEETEGRDLTREAKLQLKEHGYDGTNHADTAEAIEVRQRESILSLEVRSGWHVPGQPAEPGDYMILLSWGGPALRITGELRGWPAVAVEPCGFQLEYQDWGTPWTCYTDADADALDWFTGLFYYGE